MAESPNPGGQGACSVEISALDVRYERCRLKQGALEERLLASIRARGIEEPLEGVGEAKILLNGFKRWRCARQLGLGSVPYVSLSLDEAGGIIALLRIANDRALSILEQAAFIAELREVRGLAVGQIATELSRSKAWVSVRLSLFSEMTAAVRAKLFAGAFPVYAYMYAVRPFMRINGGAQEVEAFVLAVSGQGLSVREIELLAQGYFRGGDELRAQIRSGRVTLPLEQMRQTAAAGAAGCSEVEGAVLRDLEVTQKYMLRVLSRSEDERLQSGAFQAQAHLLTGGILRRAAGFLAAVRRLHGRGRPA